jgi:hypothetical protein
MTQAEAEVEAEDGRPNRRVDRDVHSVLPFSYAL